MTRICNIALFLLFIAALFSGCAATRTRAMIEETNERIEKALYYDAEQYTPEMIDKARGNIKSSRRMLQRKRKKEALKSARAALYEASEALRISSKSKTAVTWKEAREAKKIVDLNRAGEANPAVYEKMTGSLREAEKNFIADRFGASFNHSKDALFQAEILLEALKIEAGLTRKRVEENWERIKDSSPENEALAGEAGEAFGKRHYRRSIRIWQKMLDETE